MKGAFLTILFLSILAGAFSQGKKDSLRLPTKEATATVQKIDSARNTLEQKLDGLKPSSDSTVRATLSKADSIRSGFQTRVDSLQLSYQKSLSKIDATSQSLKQKIDSLETLKLPTDKVTAKLDSVNSLGMKKVAELNQQVEKLKSKATESLKSIDLPPDLRGPVDKLQQSVDAYKIPVVNGKIPDLGMGQAKIPGVEMPKGINAPPLGDIKISGVDGLGDLNQLKNVTGEVGDYSKDIQNISKGKLDEVKNLDKTAESEAKKLVGSKELDGMTGNLDKYKKQLGGRPDSVALSMAKEQAKEMVLKEATNHFAGKEEILKEAMDKMAKLKTKYSEVKSMADLPKRLPNPLKGKPLRERLLPGLTLQFLSEKNFLIDFNPSIAYRISPRLRSGLGWNERITFASWLPTIPERVYGLRNYTEFALPKGFNARADIEWLNAIIPPIQVTGVDVGKRAWEMSILVGLKKEFKVFKSVTGNVQTMYRIWSDHDRVPFPDRLTIRMGFEFPMKKRKKVK